MLCFEVAESIPVVAEQTVPTFGMAAVGPKSGKSENQVLAVTQFLWHIALWRTPMRNVTLAIEDQLVERGREYARRRGMSFNALIREQLQKLVYQQSDWTVETFRAMDVAAGGSRGRKWRRSELYDV